MAEVGISIFRGTRAECEAQNLRDGQILFETDQSTNNNLIYNDVGGRRVRIGGTNPVDATLSTTSTNAVQNNTVTTNTGIKTNLNTTNKTNLVSAINEVNTKHNNDFNLRNATYIEFDENYQLPSTASTVLKTATVEIEPNTTATFIVYTQVIVDVPSQADGGTFGLLLITDKGDNTSGYLNRYNRQTLYTTPISSTSKRLRGTLAITDMITVTNATNSTRNFIMEVSAINNSGANIEFDTKTSKGSHLLKYTRIK